MRIGGGHQLQTTCGGVARRLTYRNSIYATGFDAVTGAFDAIDFTGVGGRKLKREWEEGPNTNLGMTIQHFPNMFM